MDPQFHFDSHGAMSHKVDFNDIAPARVQVLTQEGAFGWQLKYSVRYCQVLAELQPTWLGKVARECP